MYMYDQNLHSLIPCQFVYSYGWLLYTLYKLDLPPPSNSYHQDYYILVGDPYKLSFATVTGWWVEEMRNEKKLVI